tara:strand:- start:949 stop:1140 length:192 start_codon:yes stop_codon:yes gene_type:complete
MKYQQLTSEYRYILADLRRQGVSISAIAEVLGKHRTTTHEFWFSTRMGVLVVSTIALIKEDSN